MFENRKTLVFPRSKTVFKDKGFSASFENNVPKITFAMFLLAAFCCLIVSGTCLKCHCEKPPTCASCADDGTCDATEQFKSEGITEGKPFCGKKVLDSGKIGQCCTAADTSETQKFDGGAVYVSFPLISFASWYFN